ncbi:MAG: hypothetical protein ACPGU7_10420 [Gammaproteobacteria bacterium]
MEIENFCHSCAAPISEGDGRYCERCRDDAGELRAYEDVHENVARWLLSWQPGIGLGVALKRAEDYLRAMPAWAERRD